MKKVKVGFQHDPLVQKLQKTEVIVDKMSGNAKFPKAQPMMAPMRALVAATRAKAQGSQLTTNGLFGKQNQMEAQLDAEVMDLCDDANSEANGDETALMSSGFELSKESTAASVPGTPGAGPWSEPVSSIVG